VGMRDFPFARAFQPDIGLKGVFICLNHRGLRQCDPIALHIHFDHASHRQ